ncbi:MULTISPECIES: S8 family peptidase [unclassified Paenibacillus]|uniref:S8 family peptidase n=1 Tax=unclassified Paenibacillus TaxID=185978 RepID=UPI00093095F1
MDQGADGSAGRYIIRFRSHGDYTSFIRYLNRQSKALPQLRQIRPLRLIRAISCPLRSGAALSSVPGVRSVEADARIQLQGTKGSALVPTSLHGSRSAPPSKIPWGIRHIQAPQVWSKSKGDRIHIGVVDTGADYNHPDLRHCLSQGINLLNRHLYPADDNGHGTHIAGTIAAYAKQRGIVGIAPHALIHPVKAFDHQGGAFVSDIIKAIDWCVLSRMDIINMSFGMKTHSKALEAAVLSAHQAGIVVVASSGNEGKRAEIDYPARFPQSIAVGATTRKGRVAPFSNDGRQIDIYAPGEKIYSTWPGGKYQELSGTSMATSHVTGVIALMLSLRPRLRPSRIKALLRKHARYVMRPGKQSFIKELHAARTVGSLSKRPGK